MGWMRQGAKAGVAPDYTGLQLQTSVNTLPIPIVMGMTKIAPNVIWYANFQSSNPSAGKGGLFAQPSGEVTYSADLILALCEGPIAGVGRIWKNQSVYTLADLGLSEFNGATPQAVWGYLEAADPGQALAYQSTAYVCAASYALGSSADISSHNFEVEGLLYGTGINGVDADPAACIYALLTSPQFGAGFDPAAIDMASLFGASGDSSLQTYCRSIGVAISPALIDQEQGSSILARWLQICNCAAVWTGGLLKFVPYAESAVSGAAASQTTLPEVVPTPPSGGGAPSIFVCGAAEFVADGGVEYALTGVALRSVGAATPSVAGTYGISPAGVYLFAAGDEGAAVAIAFTASTGVSFNPDVTPIYSLTDLDFVVESHGDDPVKVSRVDPFSLPTIQRLEVFDRDNQYAATPVEQRDQSQIEIYGPRVGSTITAHEICDVGVVAPTVCQTILQRALYVRANFTFKLSWEYCLLDPMDVVEISDANLGLTNFPVRITAIEEDDKGILTVAAEELTVGVSVPALYPGASAINTLPPFGAEPGNVNAPYFFEPPDALGGGLALLIGLSGADANWGGCDVYLSYEEDGSYAKIGSVSAATRMGALTAALAAVAPAPSGVTVDAVDTLSVDLVDSGGALSSGSSADMTAFNTACVVDQEIIAYQTATLTGENAYDLAPLARGGYDSAIAAHAVGAPFMRLDGAAFKWNYTSDRIGSTAYFKFCSFNLLGAQTQDISEVGAYAYAITGAALSSPLPDVANLRAVFENGFQRIYWDEVEDFRSGIVYEIRQGASPDSAIVLRSQAHPPFAVTGDGTYWIAARCTPITGLTVYSGSWSELEIAGAQLSLNLVATWDEQATGWSGTFDNAIGVAGGNLRLGGGGDMLAVANKLALDDVLNYGGIIADQPVYYTIPADHIIDLGYVGQASISAAVEVVGSPVGQNMLAVADKLAMLDVLGAASTQYVSGWSELAISQDGSTWGAWQKLDAGVFVGMAFKLRLGLETVDPQTVAEALAFSFSVQIKARIDHYQNLSVPSTGLTIAFQPDGAASPGPFNGGPGTADLPYVSVSWPPQAGDTYVISGESLSGLTIQFFNAGVAVARSGVNLSVEGY